MKSAIFMMIVLTFAGISRVQAAPEANYPKIQMVTEELVFRDANSKDVIAYAGTDTEKREIIKLNLEKKFLLLKSKKLSSPRLRFLNGAGGEARVIDLGTERMNVKIMIKKGETGLPGEREIVKKAKISKDGRFAVLSLASYDRILNRTTYPDAYGGQTESYEIRMYDDKGIMLFEKAYPESRGVPDPERRIAVADSGMAAVSTENSTEGCESNCEYRPELYIYDKMGREVFIYPEKSEKNVFPEEVLGISPNGKYLAVRVGFSDGGTKYFTVFVNVVARKVWKSQYDYVVYQVDNDGKVKCDFYDAVLNRPSPVAVIDITKNLKD